MNVVDWAAIAVGGAVVVSMGVPLISRIKRAWKKSFDDGDAVPSPDVSPDTPHAPFDDRLKAVVDTMIDIECTRLADADEWDAIGPFRARWKGWKLPTPSPEAKPDAPA